MAYKKLGSVERFAIGDWRYFAGYCSECKAKHYVTREQAEKFVSESHILTKRNKIGRLMAKLPRVRIEWGIDNSIRQ